jgi:hypothetical protein
VEQAHGEWKCEVQREWTGTVEGLASLDRPAQFRLTLCPIMPLYDVLLSLTGRKAAYVASNHYPALIFRESFFGRRNYEGGRALKNW